MVAGIIGIYYSHALLARRLGQLCGCSARSACWSRGIRSTATTSQASVESCLSST